MPAGTFVREHRHQGDGTMARIQLRDVCDHLSAAQDADGIIDALLAYLRAFQADWHPTLAQVDSRHDAVTRIWQRERGRLDRRDVVIPVDHLPARLVRKFFRPSAFFNVVERRSLLSRVFRATPVYEPDRFESTQVQPLAAPVAWHSCIVLPLADQDDLLALVTIVSPRKNAFTAAAVEQVLAIRTMAAVALARRLHATGRHSPEARLAEEHSRRTQGMFQERVRQLETEVGALAQDNRLKSERLELVMRQAEQVQQRAHAERAELDELRQHRRAHEEQEKVAAQHLHDAYSQLAITQQRLNDAHGTMEFLRAVFEAMAGEHDDSVLSRTLVQRFCDAFEVDRASLMRVDDQALRIDAQRGMDPTVAGSVRLPLGEGVAGWVASHRKPVLMRKTGDATPVRPTGVDSYNSDSFVSVPLVHRNRLLGVLNLSNKRNGQPFDETDLDRAMMASAVLSLAMSQREEARQAHEGAVATVEEDPPVTRRGNPSPRSTEPRDLPPFELRG
jgi:transcriptional regulator with GAF, ATPase, and Fis domain